jgi:uridine monophosphate synthetase
MKFYDKLNGAITQNQSLLFIGLDPNPEMLPERYSQKSDPKSMIDSL